jgi:hypothetical protein
MNPALMNYLQSQQTNGDMQQQAPAYNPFDSAINRAISSSRESLGMTEKQQDKALRRSMLTFANNIAQQPKQRGLFNNFGSAARALSPAIMEHDVYEDEAERENQDMANQILAYKAADEAKQNAMEHQAWGRQHAENQLGEQRRYHDMMNDYQQQKLQNQMQGQQQNINSPLSGFLPIENAKQLNDYSADKKALGSVLDDIRELTKNYYTFKDKYKDNIIEPTSAYSGIANPVKDIFGKFANNKMLRKETADRETLASQLKSHILGAENKLRGGGSLGPQLINYFQNEKIYPDLKHDTPEVLESKLDRMQKETEKRYKAAKLSLQYRIQIDPSELHQFESGEEAPSQNNIPQAATMSNSSMPQEEFITMQNPNGEEIRIPANDMQAIQDALNDNFKKM